jgi:hypothetical protein
MKIPAPTVPENAIAGRELVLNTVKRKAVAHQQYEVAQERDLARHSGMSFGSI